MNNDKVKISEEDIRKLNDSQNDLRFHPLTCNSKFKECKRVLAQESRRKGELVPYTNDNEGVLIATTDGWICPCGKYSQLI